VSVSGSGEQRNYVIGRSGSLFKISWILELNGIRIAINPLESGSTVNKSPQHPLILAGIVETIA
jgi:hypothetical protein